MSKCGLHFNPIGLFRSFTNAVRPVRILVAASPALPYEFPWMRAPDNAGYPGSSPERPTLAVGFLFFGLAPSPFGITENSSARGFLRVHSKMAWSRTVLPYPSSRP